jgi:hypothetical protein
MIPSFDVIKQAKDTESYNIYKNNEHFLFQVRTTDDNKGVLFLSSGM